MFGGYEINPEGLAISSTLLFLIVLVGISFRQRYRVVDNKSFNTTPGTGSQSESPEVVVAKDADLDGGAVYDNSEDDYEPYYDYEDDYDYEPYYDYEDEEFYSNIEKQFKRFTIPENKLSMKQICQPRKFKLQIPQRFIRQWINPKTPYKGILIYHKIGAGKTCTAVNVGEGWKKKRTEEKKAAPAA